MSTKNTGDVFICQSAKLHILTSHICFHEFNVSITVTENLCMEQLCEWAVICSMFQRAVCRKGSEAGEGVRDDFLCSVSGLFEVQ